MFSEFGEPCLPKSTTSVYKLLFQWILVSMFILGNTEACSTWDTSIATRTHARHARTHTRHKPTHTWHKPTSKVPSPTKTSIATSTSTWYKSTSLVPSPTKTSIATSTSTWYKSASQVPSPPKTSIATSTSAWYKSTSKVSSTSKSSAWSSTSVAASNPSDASMPPPKVPDDLGTHDPSRLINDNGSYYFYSTSDDLSGWYTTDGGNEWKQIPAVFPNGLPSDVHDACPENDGHDIWAPDVIWNPNTNLFHIYYAVAAWDDKDNSVIGLVTSPTLDPSSAEWKDEGIVIAQTSSSSIFTAIDPAPFFDDDGNMWLSLGSGYLITRDTAINVIALDKMTGLRSDSSVHTIQACGCEASYIHPYDGYYYLFWNTGGCCDGAESTYTIHVARSTSVTGPYGESQTFFSSDATEHGPGQIGILTQEGQDYFTYHYYPNSGGSVLGMGTVDWSTGWPTAG